MKEEMNEEMNEEESTPRRGGGWLSDILGIKRLESDYGDCPDCGRKNVEFKVYQSSQGTIRKTNQCPDCNAMWKEERRQEEEMARQAEIVKERRQWRDTCGIPPHFANEDFSTYDTKWSDKSNNLPKTFKTCWDYAEGFPVNYPKHLNEQGKAYLSLVMLSPETQGVGKTHLCVAICHRIIERWQGEPRICPVEFVSEPQLYNKIQTTFSYTFEEKRNLPSEQDIVNRLIYKSLLVLDDVGTEERYDKKFTTRILFALINGRYENNRPVVMTSNLSAEDLNIYFADGRGSVRIYDRLLEMCGGSFLRIFGESHRRKG
jgi:DNA replication protein DnaC